MAETGSMPRVLLDRYELRERVGRGGMGEVWLGWDRRLMRDVAVKVLLPQLSAEPAYRERFHIEARVAAALAHPNVVNVFDIDEDAAALFIVMERLPGPSLDLRLMEGPMTEDEVLRLAADMLAGLGAAHRQNLIHRDMKPGNLIRSAGGRWKVGDFGVAKDLASMAHLTLAGVPVGTPAYLAPEQLDGRQATPATDLWAAAIVLREALTGRRPFPGDDPVAVAHAIQNTRLEPLAVVRPDLHQPLTASVDRALAYDPAQRFASASDMLAAIQGRASLGPAVASAVPASPAPLSPPPPPAPALILPPPAPLVAAEPGAPAHGGALVTEVTGPVTDDPLFGPNLTPEADRAVRRVAIIAIVLGLLALMFLAGISLGLLMLSSDDGEGRPSSTTYGTPDDGRESNDVPRDSSDSSFPRSSSTSTPTTSTTTTTVEPGGEQVRPDSNVAPGSDRDPTPRSTEDD